MKSLRAKKLRRIIKWFYPGLGVKRWAGLVVISVMAIITGLLLLFGRDFVRSVYATFQLSSFQFYSIAVIFIAGGLIGAGVGINLFFKSILRGIAPETEGKTADVLYEKRLLSRGPKIVALGGGTGLSTLLRGLKEYTSNITAVVTVMDDGGSSGKLRKELDILPPGDIRNCIIALADDESSIARIFQHRFKGGLDSHSLGNLVIAGLKEITGRFDKAIEEMSHVLRIRGRVLPATLEKVDLVAEMEDGERVRGECSLAEDPRRIKKMLLSKERVSPYSKVIEAIRKAEIIILGPGSLFTSIIPNLLVSEVAYEIKKSEATKFYVVNLMTQPGETDGFTAKDHLNTLSQYLDINCFDYIIINSGSVPENLREQYEKEGAIQVRNDLTSNKVGPRIILEDLLEVVELENKPTVKHNPKRLAKVIMKNFKK